MHLPKTPDEWLAEILLAFEDAAEAKPFAPLTGTVLTDKNMFHLAPAVALKLRGLDLPERKREAIVKTVLANYVVHTNPKSPSYVPGLKRNSKLAFALCYVATHFALDLVSQEDSTAILEHCEAHLRPAKGR